MKSHNYDAPIELPIAENILRSPILRAQTENGCGNCEFSRPDPQTEMRCHRLPPQVSVFVVPMKPKIGMPGQMQMAQQLTTNFPPVQKGMWCGEHRPKPSADKAASET